MSNFKCSFHTDAMFHEFRDLASFDRRPRINRGTNFNVIQRYPKTIVIRSLSLIFRTVQWTAWCACSVMTTGHVTHSYTHDLSIARYHLSTQSADFTNLGIFELVYNSICLDVYNKHVQLTHFRTVHTRVLGQIPRQVAMVSAEIYSISIPNQHLLKQLNFGKSSDGICPNRIICSIE